MKVLIVEDEAPAARRLTRLLNELDENIKVLETLDTIAATVAWFEHHTPPDLLFLDIQLADGLSFQIFNKMAIPCPIVFTTAYDEYTLDAFRVNSIDYLLKPIRRENLAQSLQKLSEVKDYYRGSPPKNIENLLQQVKTDEYRERFLVRLGERLVSVPIEEVAYFVTEEKVVILHTHDGKRYALDYALDELEAMLDPKRHFRLNRQVISSFDAIRAVHQHFKGKLLVKLHPEPSQEVLVSREKSPVFKQWLGK